MQKTQETWVRFLGQEDLLEERHGNPFQYSWLKNPTEEPRGLQAIGSQRVRHNLVTEQQQQTVDLQCVLVSAIQQNESVTHTSTLFWIFSYIGHYRVLSRGPCAIQ